MYFFQNLFRKAKLNSNITKLKELLEAMKKDTYLIGYRKVDSVDQLDSFTSKVFVGTPDIIQSSFQKDKKAFILQLKHPENEIWYRVYIAESELENSDSLKLMKNGNEYFIQRFKSKPDVTFNHELTNTQSNIPLINREITFTKGFSLPSITMLSKNDEIKSLATDISKVQMEFWSDVLRKISYEVTNNQNVENYIGQFLGYCNGEFDTSSLPNSFSGDNFLFELATEDSFVVDDGFDIGALHYQGVYVFEREGDFLIAKA